MQTDYYKDAAGIATRYLITGKLKLIRPTSLSNGDADGLTDISLRRDVTTDKPLLPGTSLAGALRDYLWQRVGRTGLLTQDMVNTLFGYNSRQSSSSHQSWLLVEDALGVEKGVEIRDGVMIDPKTRTAAENKKFDAEFLAAGTTFDLQFEFWEPRDPQSAPLQLRQLLAHALTALGDGAIPLGGRKRRGFGECTVSGWQVHRYSMDNKVDIVRWLESDLDSAENGTTIADMLQVGDLPQLNVINQCRLKATFVIDGSLLIRSTSKDARDADQIHLQNANGQPIISGTSLAGALRAHTGRIARQLKNEHDSKQYVNDLFGQSMDEVGQSPMASRIWVREMPIRSYAGSLINDRVQNRVKIDRFTGGSYPTALFDQQPVFQGEVTLDVTIQKVKDEDVGMLMLLLKDLWMGELPIGGEASVGRGRLRGLAAHLVWKDRSWRIRQQNNRLEIHGDDRKLLEDAVQALKSN